MMEEIVKRGEYQALFSDPEAFEEAMKGYMGMFDREVFDCILVFDKASSMFAAVLADRFKRPVIFDVKDVSKGNKILIMADSLGDGQCLKKVAEAVEAQGGEVLRIGCIVEKASEGARKSKLLRPYPFEALVLC